MSIIYSSHLLADVERVCDQAVFLRGGAVIALLGPESDPDRVLAALRNTGATEAFVTEIERTA